MSSRGLTFELSRPWRQTPAGRGRTISTMAWSGQTAAAVAGRRLSEGLGLTVRRQDELTEPTDTAPQPSWQ